MKSIWSLGDGNPHLIMIKRPIRITVTISCLLILLAVSGSCRKMPPEEKPIVLGWGKPLITKGEFDRRLKESYADCVESLNPPCMRVREELLAQMIEEVLVIEYAQRRGWNPSENELQGTVHALFSSYEGAEEVLDRSGFDPERAKRLARAQLAMSRLMEELAKGVKVTSREVVRYFRDHRELFVAPREVRIRQIVVARAEEALRIRNRLKKGEDFARLAQDHSLAPEGALGGDLGYLRPGQMPAELGDVVFSLKEGAVSDVIPSPYGFHIIRVEDHREPRELKFHEVRERIENRIYLQKLQGAYDRWLGEIWQEADIQVLDPALRVRPLAEEGG